MSNRFSAEIEQKAGKASVLEQANKEKKDEVAKIEVDRQLLLAAAEREQKIRTSELYQKRSETRTESNIAISTEVIDRIKSFNVQETLVLLEEYRLAVGGKEHGVGIRIRLAGNSWHRDDIWEHVRLDREEFGRLIAGDLNVIRENNNGRFLNNYYILEISLAVRQGDTDGVYVQFTRDGANLIGFPVADNTELEELLKSVFLAELTDSVAGMQYLEVRK